MVNLTGEPVHISYERQTVTYDNLRIVQNNERRQARVTKTATSPLPKPPLHSVLSSHPGQSNKWSCRFSAKTDLGRGDARPTLGRDTTPVSGVLNPNGGKSSKRRQWSGQPHLAEVPTRVHFWRLILRGKLFNSKAQSLYNLSRNQDLFSFRVCCGPLLLFRH